MKRIELGAERRITTMPKVTVIEPVIQQLQNTEDVHARHYGERDGGDTVAPILI